MKNREIKQNFNVYFTSRNFYLNEIQVGSSLSRDQFKGELNKIFNKLGAPVSAHSLSKTAVILLNNLNDQDVRYSGFTNGLQDNANIIYKPAVNEPYPALVDYLNDNLMRSEIFQRDDINDALDLFNELNNKQFDAIVLTGMESNMIQERRKRQSPLNSRDSNSSITVFGTKCAAAFDNIAIYNSKEGKYNSIKIKNMQFNCSSNASAV